MAKIITNSNPNIRSIITKSDVPKTNKLDLSVAEISVPAINNKTGLIAERIQALDAAKGVVASLLGLTASNTNTVAMGVLSGAWLKVDPTNGVRIGFGTTTNIQLDASGNASFTGAVTATSGSFTGSITSTSGTIGGFTISATELYAGSGATRVEMQAAGGFWAGATTFAAAPFSVSPAGVLTATNATITGSITATLGTIAGWTIGATELVGPSGVAIRSGQTAYNTGTGFYLGNVGGTPQFSIGAAGTSSMTWDGTTLGLTGSGTTLQVAGAMTLRDTLGGTVGITLDGAAQRVTSSNFLGGIYNCNVTGYQFNGTKVVGAQGAAVANSTDITDAAAQLNLLLARLRTHGLIAT